MTNDGAQDRISTGPSPAWENEVGAQPGSIPQQMSWTGTYQGDNPNGGSPPRPAPHPQWSSQAWQAWDFPKVRGCCD